MPVAGAVIVTTPQEMALDDTRKGIQMFQKHDTPILGIVENMSAFVCPTCEDEHELLGDREGVEQTLEDYNVPLAGRLPMHPDFGADGSEGAVVKDDDSPVQGHVETLVGDVADRIGEVNRRKVTRHRAGAADDTDDAESPVAAEYDVFD